MREQFSGWYRKTPNQLSTIWDAAVFVPDANILLHCLRHPKDVRDQFLRLFGVLRESLWIPYQVGLEFHRNRLDVEFGSRDAYDRVAEDCTAVLEKARDRLGQLRAHPVIDIERELNALDRFVTDFRARLRTDKENHPTQAISEALDRLTELLEGRVGEKWKDDQLKALQREGEERYANKIPPGYKDSRKGTGQFGKYGDLIIWKDMITKAEQEQRPVVFISDDVKEDWWWIHRGERLGPRPEIIQEFKECSGQSFYIYQFAEFLRIAAGRHPEIEAGVTEIEKSLREDEQAKRRLDGAAAARALRLRISELEEERDGIISTLSGTPMRGEFPQSNLDRPALRARFEALNTELQELNATLYRETASDT